jgi:type II secretory pathway component PulJ
MITQNCCHTISQVSGSDGFILLEVLVAMSLIMGAWTVSTNAYQRLALTLSQQESKRSQIRREMDAHEIEIYSKTVASNNAGGIKNELARLSGRNHALRSSPQSSAKGKRSTSN